MAVCHFCKKEYGGYYMFIKSRTELLVLEDHIKELYYKKREGICEECRSKEIKDNPVVMIRIWLSISTRLALMKHNAEKKGDAKAVKDFEEALERIKGYKVELEKTPEVKALYMKNNPAGFKKPPKVETMCSYCGENLGKIWINNPNEHGNPKIENCWWVCPACEEIIELQFSLSFGTMFEDRVKGKGMDKLAEKVHKRNVKVMKKIDDVAYEAGLSVISAGVKRK